MASVAFLVAARIRNAPYYLFLAGLFAGAGWYTLSVARVAIGLVMFGCYRPVSIRIAARDMSVVLAGFLLLLLPFVIVNGQTIVTVIVDQSRWGDSGLPPLGVRLSQNGLRSIFSYIYYPSADNHYVVGALWDTVSAGCLLLGMAALLIRRSSTGVFLLLCFWLQVVVNGPTYYDLHLNTTRMYVLAPFAAVIAGIGGSTLLRLIGELTPDRSRRRITIFVGSAALISAAVALNLTTSTGLCPKRSMRLHK